MKKIVGYLLICLMIIGLMSGCKAESSTGATAVKDVVSSGGEEPALGEEPTQSPAVMDDGLVSVWIADTKEINGRLFEVSYGEDLIAISEVYRKDGEELRRYTYETNELGRITKVIGTGEITRNQQYVHDEAGRLISFEDYDDDGELNEKHIYTYDDQGRLLEHTNYWNHNGKAKIDWRRVYRYDEFGNLSEMLEYETEDESDLERHCTYTYNAEGQCVSCRQVWKNDQYSTEHTYTYDHRGNLKSEEANYIADGSNYYTTQWAVVVDENGNTTQIFGGRNSSLRRYTYKEVRVKPEMVDKIQRNQADILATDIPMTSNYEIKKPI